LLWNLPLPSFVSAVSVAGLIMLKLGGLSALCMPATRTTRTDASHMRLCSKDNPINSRIFYRCEPYFHASKTTCYISMFPSWICVLWLIKINTCLQVNANLAAIKLARGNKNWNLGGSVYTFANGLRDCVAVSSVIIQFPSWFRNIF